MESVPVYSGDNGFSQPCVASVFSTADEDFVRKVEAIGLYFAAQIAGQTCTTV